MAERNFRTTTCDMPPESDISIAISTEDIRELRSVILIGLSSFGEVDRLRDEVAGLDAALDAAQIPYPGALRPIHPTGSNDTISQFAEALRILERLAWSAGQAE